jgi:Na+/proline symporter
VFVLFMWYVAGVTDGGTYFAQRMLSAKNERHAALGYLWYAVAHYAIRMWPWIVVGFAAAVMFPYTRDAVTGEYPGGAVAENGYVKVMLAVLPTGLLGLLIASFLAAFMSTVSTQLNLGASYLLNDLYRPFIRKNGSEKHYVLVSQLFTVLIALVGIVISLFLRSISDAWFVIGTLNAGTGLIYLLRWFWWRVNAWTEITCLAAMVFYGVLYKVLEDHVLFGVAVRDWVPPYPLNLLLLVPYAVGTALLVTFLTRPVAREKLIAFVRKVQPGGPGWRCVETEIRKTDLGFRSNSTLRWVNARRWIAGTAAIYCFLFGVGKLVIGDAFTPEPWVPGRLIGLALVVVGLLLGTVVARSFSETQWSAERSDATS